MTTQNKQLFELGTIVATPGILAEHDPIELFPYLQRHSRGDWGDISAHDKKENDYSVSRHLRIMSAYTLENGDKMWIITEADRSSTTFLLPDEY